jgi:hypothetical protein
MIIHAGVGLVAVIALSVFSLPLRHHALAFGALLYALSMIGHVRTRLRAAAPEGHDD